MFDQFTFCILEGFRLAVEVIYARTLFEEEAGKLRKYALYAAALLLTIISYLVFRHFILNVAATLVSCFLISCAFCTKWQQKIFYAAGMLAVSAAIDFCAGYLLSENPQSMAYDFAVSAISVLLFLLSAVFFRSFYSGNKEAYGTKHMAYLALTFMMGIGAMILLARDEDISRHSLILVGMFFLLADFMIMFIYDTLSANFADEREKRILQEQNRIYEYQIESEKERSGKLRAIRHDMKNHLAQLSHLIVNGQSEEALDYIRSISGELSEATPAVSCGVCGIDGILNYKIQEAEKAGVKVKSHVTVPESLRIPAYDMNIILGNLMDNAIEAAVGWNAAHPADTKPIRVRIKYARSCLHFHIENAYEGEICVRNQKYVSSKPNPAEHGYGLYNVNRIVEQHDGLMNITHENGIFDVKIMLMGCG